jgi:hypothetical protein
LKEVGTIIVCCTGSAKGKTFFKVTKRMIKQSVFCVIEDSGAPYEIRNKLETIELKVA